MRHPLSRTRNLTRGPLPNCGRPNPVATDMTPSLPARLVLAGLLALPSLHAAPAPAIALPKSTDPRLEFTFVASEPQIVTPIGIAVDRRNRLFIVESYTAGNWVAFTAKSPAYGDQSERAGGGSPGSPITKLLSEGRDSH